MRSFASSRGVVGLVVLTVGLAGCTQLESLLPTGAGQSCRFGMSADVDRVSYEPAGDARATITNIGDCALEGPLSLTLEMPDGTTRPLLNRETRIEVGESLNVPFTIPSRSALPDGEAILKLSGLMNARFNRQTLDVRASAFVRVENFNAPEVGDVLADPAGRFTLHYNKGATSQTYANVVAQGIDAAWDFFVAKGLTPPSEHVHAYVEPPTSDKELGTLSTQRYGLKLVVAPESTFAAKDSNEQTPAIVAAHEVFHAFQTSYDLEEKWLVEGMATWAMDKVKGTKSGLNHGIQFLNNPDSKPGQFLEYGLALFLIHLEEKYGEAAVWSLLDSSKTYDNAYVFEDAFGKDYDSLWADFVRAIAEQDFRDRFLIFKPSVREGDIIRSFRDLRNYTWAYAGGSATLAGDLAAGLVRDTNANDAPEAGVIRHAYGVEALRITRSSATPFTFTYSAKDATSFHAYLVIATGPTRSAQTLEDGVPFTVDAPADTEVLFVIARGDAGAGGYQVALASA